MDINDINEIKNLKQKAENLQKYLNENSDDVDFDEIMNELGVDIVGLEKDMKNYKPKLDLKFKKITSDAVAPKYNYESDSGFDLYSTEDITIEGFGRALVPTGLSFDIDEMHEIQVRSKSGLAINEGLMVLNSPGTIDQGFSGEIQVIMFNTTKEKIKIEKGQKVAQAVVCPILTSNWIDIKELESVENKDRGSNGFGSTGI